LQVLSWNPPKRPAFLIGGAAGRVNAPDAQGERGRARLVRFGRYWILRVMVLVGLVLARTLSQ
jgi:hypothetical protein